MDNQNPEVWNRWACAEIEQGVQLQLKRNDPIPQTDMAAEIYWVSWEWVDGVQHHELVR